MDKEALISLYEEHSPGVYRYAYRLLGRADLAEDCVADTFSRFLHAIRRGKGPTEHVKAYLYRIAHNCAADHHRRELPALPLDPELKSEPEGAPDWLADRKMERERVRSAILSLPVEQQMVIQLRFYEEWPHEEVAAALGKTTEATRALQYRALAALRHSLTEQESGKRYGTQPQPKPAP